jgi:hypothetical protein
MFIYKNDEGNLVFETWGASTKHPDTVYHFEDFQKTEYFQEIYQVFQWLCEIASRQVFPMHAKEIMDYAYDKWNLWDLDEEDVVARIERLDRGESI